MPVVVCAGSIFCLSMCAVVAAVVAVVAPPICVGFPLVVLVSSPELVSLMSPNTRGVASVSSDVALYVHIHICVVVCEVT